MDQRGHVKCWGYNEQGQLGLDDNANRGDEPNEMGNNLPFVNLGEGKTTKSVAVGWYHSCAVLNDNSLKCWGWNWWGQLRVGDVFPRSCSTPTLVTSLGTTVKSVVLGESQSCAILNDNSIKCWGKNWPGELALGYVSNSVPTPTLVTSLGATVKSIALGSGHALSVGHSCAILNDDSIKCWGANSYGELGLGYVSDNVLTPTLITSLGTTVKSVALGDYHGCVVLNDNSLKCWGWNNAGQLGLGYVSDISDSVLTPTLVTSLDATVKSIALSQDRTCAVLNDHSLKCWGWNYSGQSGLGNTNHRIVSPASVNLATTAPSIGLGSGHTCAIFNDNSLKCWGGNHYGQLGLGDTTNRGDTPDTVPALLPAVLLGDT